MRLSRRLPLGRRHGRCLLGDVAAAWSTGSLAARLARDPRLAGLGAGDLCFVDTETTGLGCGAGLLVFVVGSARVSRDGAVLEVDQLLLTRPSSERELLSACRGPLERAGALVSFNGRPFDLPLLETRCAMSRLPPLAVSAHLDLLPLARRLFGGLLADVRLASLERGILDVIREDDLPGSEAPAAWRAFLRDGDAEGVGRVLAHNLLDLLSLVTLLVAVLETAADRTRRWPGDPLALAETWHRLGSRRRARAALEGGPVRATADERRAVRHARLVKRLHGAAAAAPLWRALWEGGRGGVEAAEELAKWLEHGLRDLRGARRIVEAALAGHGGSGRVRVRLAHRLGRLERRLARETAARACSTRRRI